jgi:tungstate transport system substrate-binding protein
MKKFFFTCLIGLLTLSCGSREERSLHLATTTSVEDSGILEHLLEPFEKETGIDVKAIAVGSGRALQLGRTGDVDLVFTHAPLEEEAFMKSGYGANRHGIMYNYFVVLGPPDDPAGIRGTVEGSRALARILESGALFFSRGDASGTHSREMAMWQEAGMTPGGDGYRETGQGMGATLRITDEMEGYTLCDTGTFTWWKDQVDLEILSGSSPSTVNRYSVIPIDPELHPHVNFDGAMKLVEWLTSTPCQKLIANYRVNGEQPFRPVTGVENSSIESADH